MRVGSMVSALLVLLGACGGGDRMSVVVDDGGAPMGDAGPSVEDAGPSGLPLLGSGTHSVDDVSVGEVGADLGVLATPRDLAFNPEEPSQLWVLNQANDSTVIFFDPATPEEDWNRRAGFGNTHFLASPAALAFGAPGTFATAQEEDAVTQPSTPADFMGPVLWTSDVDEYDSGHASHLDMLHNSPNSVGIAWDHDNVYWVFDGYHQSITRYDFQSDHGPAGADHSDGIIARYVEGEVGYVPGVTSSMELDHDTGLLYVADTGNGRIAVLDTASGERGGSIGPNYDGAEMYEVTGATLTTLVDGAEVDMPRPSGLELHDGLLWVSDNQTGRILAFSLDGMLVDWLDFSSQVEPNGLGSMAFGPDGALYVIDQVAERILYVTPGS